MDSIDHDDIHSDIYDSDNWVFYHKQFGTVDNFRHNTKWAILDRMETLKEICLFHTLRLHGCFPHSRIRVHLLSQRNSWQHGMDFSFKPHRHRFIVTCRHFEWKFLYKRRLNISQCILLIHNHPYDIDANIDEDHNQVFYHKYRHMLEHLLNMANFRILY